jgi:chromosome segregation protein
MDSGAHYFKADLQVHTPRDGRWKGDRPVSDEDRERYARRFVSACRANGLQAVAITDHHDVALLPYIRAAAAAEVGPGGKTLPAHERLVVFPGIELTLAVPCQALLLFDADFSDTDLARVLDVLTITSADAAEAKGADPVALAYLTELRGVYEQLDHHAWLKGRYILLPNVTDGGLGTLIRKRMQQKYIDMPCVGAYVDGPITKLGYGARKILDGEDQAWGYKRVAVVQTSDSRAESFELLGAHATWIKWAAPTAEALRQACLAQESRIVHSEPELPSVVVTRLSVSNSKFMGPVELELNPQYNAIIGGRGTGKSTLLEYLRWALCDQPGQHQEAEEIPDQAARRRRLIGQTLAPVDGHVEVHLLVNGIPHLVRRHGKSGEVLLRVGSGELKPTTHDDVRALLPVQAYSQKQLSSVSVRVDELARFVTSPIRESLDAIAGRESEIAARTRENFVHLQRRRALQRSIAREEILAASLAQQAQSLREGLDAVTPEDRAVLADKPRHDAADRTVSAWNRRLERVRESAEEYASTISRLAAEIAPTPDSEAVAHRDLLVSIEGALRDALSDTARLAGKAVSKARAADATDGTLGKLLADWQKMKTAFAEQYAGATERSAAHRSKLEELAKLEDRRRDAQNGVDEQKEELGGLGEPDQKHADYRAEWRDLQAERTTAIEGECAALTSLSGGLIRARVLRSAGLDLLHERFKSAITGSNVRAAKVEAFIKNIAEAAEPLTAWEDAMDELEAVTLTRDDPGSGPTILKTALTRFKAEEVEKMAALLTPEGVLELKLLPMDDHPAFEYQTKDGEYITFEDASAGQQATALVRVLLNQSGPPLIIDQPEEDLDSQVILEIVDQIWQAKRRRQLIFTSHNANLVVNGDAEQVVCCDYRAAGDQSGAQIKATGAIDIPGVREEITNVMEGGEKAFRLRKEKYGF